MKELIVAGFKGETTADEVLLDLEKMQQIPKISIDEAVVAIRRADGTTKIKHASILVMKDAVIGGVLGMIAGPGGVLIGGLIGAAFGESLKVLSHVGISDDFIKQVAEVLEPGNSAIFIRTHKDLTNDVIAELEKFDGRLLRSTLSINDEKELVEALEKHQLLK